MGVPGSEARKRREVWEKEKDRGTPPGSKGRNSMRAAAWMGLKGMPLGGKASLKRSHTVWCHLHNTLEVIK